MKSRDETTNGEGRLIDHGCVVSITVENDVTCLEDLEQLKAVAPVATFTIQYYDWSSDS